jgi:transposase
LKDKIMEYAEPFMKEMQMLASMKGISVFIAIAIIADIIKADRFGNSKAFTPYLRSAPRVANSNASVGIRGTNKKGRKLSSGLITRPLNHMLEASERLNERYGRQTQYKKARLVRSGLLKKNICRNLSNA